MSGEALPWRRDWRDRDRGGVRYGVSVGVGKAKTIPSSWEVWSILATIDDLFVEKIKLQPQFASRVLDWEQEQLDQGQQPGASLFSRGPRADDAEVRGYSVAQGSS